MAAAEVGDDVYGEDPTVNALEAARRRAVRARGGAVRPVRHDGQPDRPAAARPARRRAARRRRRARRHVRDGRGRRATAGSPPAPGRAVGAALDADADRRDDPPGRLPVGADPGDRRRADPQPGRRRRDPAGHPARPARGSPTTPGVAPALRRRPDLARPRRRRRAAGRPTARSSTPCRSACPRASARRSARWSSAARSASPGPGSSASGWAAACARPASSPRPAGTPWTTTSTGSPTTTPGPRRLAEALAPFGVVDAAAVRTNLVPLDLTKAAPGRARRWPRRPREQGVLIVACWPADRPPGHPPGRRRRRASTGRSRC